MDQNEKLDLVLEKLTELDNKMLYLFDKLEDTNQRIDAIYPNVGLYYKSIKKDLVTLDNNSLNNSQKLSDNMDSILEGLIKSFNRVDGDLESIKNLLYSIDSSMMKQY